MKMPVNKNEEIVKAMKKKIISMSDKTSSMCERHLICGNCPFYSKNSNIYLQIEGIESPTHITCMRAILMEVESLL